MEVIALAYAIVFVLYTLLTFGWLIHILMNKNEATKAHWLILLLPFSAWLVYLFGMWFYASAVNYYAALVEWKAILLALASIFSSLTMFVGLAMLASGYCLLPNGLVPNRTPLILALALGTLLCELLRLYFAANYVGFVLIVVYITQLVLLYKWSSQTFLLASENPNANLLVGTWAISYPHRVQVASGTKKVIVAYIMTLILVIIVSFAFTMVLIKWAFDANDGADASRDFPDFVSWTVALLVLPAALQALLFVYLASVWRLGSTQTYALLPQYGQPSAPAYGTHVGGNYAPAPNGVYNTAPTGVYGTAPTGVYGTAPSVNYASAPQY